MKEDVIHHIWEMDNDSEFHAMTLKYIKKGEPEYRLSQIVVNLSLPRGILVNRQQGLFS